jgi:hypothetical protein
MTNEQEIYVEISWSRDRLGRRWKEGITWDYREADFWGVISDLKVSAWGPVAFCKDKNRFFDDELSNC